MGTFKASRYKERGLEREIKIHGCDKCTFRFFIPGPASFCEYYRKGITRSNNGKPNFCNIESITINEAEA